MKLKYMILAAAALTLTACSEDGLESSSIFDNSSSAVQNDFDRWLQKNYVEPYNIEFKYRFEYKESDPQYNLAPADYDKSIALAKLTKFLWIEPYEQLMGKDFIRTYAPKILSLVGSVAYNSNGGVVLGTAEGGMKIVLYNVNNLDPDNLSMEFLNEWYFNTMHHEFSHILHQTKAYSTDFNEISKADYQSDSWVNLSDEEALAMGFVNNYASSETREDFVQTIAFYITKSDEEWQELLDQTIVVVTDENGDPVYELDEHGNVVYVTDEEGYPVPARDRRGNIIYQTDQYGNYVWATDENGNFVFRTDDEGNRIPMTDSEGNIIYQTTDEGEIVYDAQGNPVPEYWKIPVPEFEKQLMLDYSGYNKLMQKLAMVKDYLKNNWNIDIEELHRIVQERMARVAAGELDLKSLN